MAKKKEEEEDFQLPELDEKTFLKREISKGKGVVITYVFGIILGFVSAFLQYIGLLPLSYIAGIAFAFLIPYIIRFMKIEIDRKSLTYDIIIYILGWLTFWIIAINPPFPF